MSEPPLPEDAFPAGVLVTVQLGAGFFSSGDTSIPTEPTGVIAFGVPFRLDSFVLEPRLHLQISGLSFQTGANNLPPPTDSGLISSAILEARVGYAFERLGLYVEGGGGPVMISGLMSTAIVGGARIGFSVELPISRNLAIVLTPLSYTAIAASDTLKGEVGAIQRIDVLIGASYLF